MGHSLVSSLDLDLSGIGVASESDGYRELLHEDREGPQFPGKHKVKERPQLLQVVLHRRA